MHTEVVRAVLDEHAHQPGAMLPVLHGIQDRLGYVPDEAVPLVAKRLNVSRAEVHGVITFYHHFRRTPPGRHVVRLCQAEACQAVGSDALAEHAKRRLGCGFHETTADGAITLEPVYCLGLCANGPSALVDEVHVHAHLTPERFDALVHDLSSEARA